MAYVDQYRCAKGSLRRYRAFGLKIESQVEIPGLVQAPFDDSPDIRVRLGLPDLPQTPESVDGGPGERKLIEYSPLLVGVDYPDRTRFVLDRAATTVWIDWQSPYTLADMATYFQGPVLGAILHLRGQTPLHGSCVSIDGKAAVFVGPAGAGKSTTAAALAEKGCPVLAEDVVATDLIDGEFFVRPAYPHIRLWPRSVEYLLGTGHALQPITPNWDKLDYPLHDSFPAESAPIRAIYVLAPRSTGPDRPNVEPLGAIDALIEVLGNRYANWRLDPGKQAIDFQFITSLVQTVQVRLLKPSDDPAKLGLLSQLILDDFRKVRERMRCTA